MLDLVKLKTFQVVAATRNFTRAAAELGYSQSSITTHVQLLEREVGAQLLDRATRNVVLTDAGRRTLEYADRLLALADEAKEVISKPADIAGQVSVSIPNSLAVYRMPDLMRRFHGLYPGVNLHLISHADTESQVDALLQEQVDMAFLVGAPLRAVKLTTAFLAAEEILIVAAPDFGAVGAFRLENLPEEQLLLTEKSCPFRRIFEQALTSAQVTLKRTLTFGSADAIKRWAMAGIGLGVVPKSAVAAELEHNSLVALPWHPSGIHADIQMLRRRSVAAPALQVMWDFVQESFHRLSEPGEIALAPA